MNAHVPAIYVRDLRKTYQVAERDAGVAAALKSLIHRKTRDVHAVAGVSFEIAPGEVVGFLGPNGAGKTTTLKMLSGLLQPTSGEARVIGHTPIRRERGYLSQITLVMGQRNQLQWDIPAADSFEVNRAIYRIPREQFNRTRDELVELLDLTPLLSKPVRNLSLGERMKCEIAGALLHQPKVLFLDEPTIGLDLTAQRRIRDFLREYNARYGSTIILTSHYMADVEALCKRVIVVHHGRIIFDGELAALARQFNTHKTILVRAGEIPLTAAQLARFGELVESADPTTFSIRVPRADAARITGQILSELSVSDVSIAEPPIEDAIERIFATPNDAPAVKEAG